MSNSFLLKDKDKINLNQYALFDKVINLKLFSITPVVNYIEKSNGEIITYGDVKRKNETYVIRSDYEIVPLSGGVDSTKAFNSTNHIYKNFTIRRCIIKPGIKVHYRNYGSTTIGLDIYLSNFFMFDAYGNKIMSFSKEHPITSVELTMGYFGQFNKSKPKTLEEFFDISNDFGASTIKAEVQYVTTENLPPDYTLHISCVVGSNYNNQRLRETTVNKAVNLIDESVRRQYQISNIDDAFYQLITRRFLKGEPEEKIVVNTRGYIVNEEQAKKYGVKVFPTERASNLVNEVIKSYGSSSLIFTFEPNATADATFIKICQYLGIDLRKRMLNSGDWVVFTKEEALNINEIMKGAEEHVSKSEYYDVIPYEDNRPVRNVYNHILPAVYNINVGVTTQITAPFFYFVDTFEFVTFESRYAGTSLVTYFTDIAEEAIKFYVYSQETSFATVDDVNETTFNCIYELDKGDSNE